MQQSITETIKGAILEEVNAKLFLKAITDCFIENKKVEMSTIFLGTSFQFSIRIKGT